MWCNCAVHFRILSNVQVSTCPYCTDGVWVQYNKTTWYSTVSKKGKRMYKKIIISVIFCIVLNANFCFSQCASNNWYGLAKIVNISVDKDYMTISPATFVSGEYWCGSNVRIPMDNSEPYKTWRAQAYIAFSNEKQVNFHTSVAAADTTGGVLDIAGWNVYFTIYK